MTASVDECPPSANSSRRSRQKTEGRPMQWQDALRVAGKTGWKFPGSEQYARIARFLRPLLDGVDGRRKIKTCNVTLLRVAPSAFNRRPALDRRETPSRTTPSGVRRVFAEAAATLPVVTFKAVPSLSAAQRRAGGIA